jgi:hypothetical protein
LENLEFESKGGYFYTIDINAVVPLPQIASVGEVPPDKVRGRLKNATEKTMRMWVHDLNTSFEMRNEGLEQWGGGIRYTNTQENLPPEILLTAFSGYPEQVDEAICLIHNSLRCYLHRNSRLSHPEQSQEIYAGNNYSLPKTQVLTDANAICPNNIIIPVLLNNYLKSSDVTS